MNDEKYTSCVVCGYLISDSVYRTCSIDCVNLLHERDNGTRKCGKCGCLKKTNPVTHAFTEYICSDCRRFGGAFTPGKAQIGCCKRCLVKPTRADLTLCMDCTAADKKHSADVHQQKAGDFTAPVVDTPPVVIVNAPKIESIDEKVERMASRRAPSGFASAPSKTSKLDYERDEDRGY
jgi:hypothetical protein